MAGPHMAPWSMSACSLESAPVASSQRYATTLIPIRYRVYKKALNDGDHARQFERDRVPFVPDHDGQRTAERRFLQDADIGAGAQPDLAQVAQNLRHLLGDTVNLRPRTDVELPVRTDLRIVENRDQTFLDASRDSVFEPACFAVDLVPRHPQDFGQEALGQAVPAHHAHRDLEPLPREFCLAARPVLDVAFIG